MRIKKMTASFGRLQNETLEPGPGLTILEAPNEGGKSTWAAFLRAMLYGFPRRDRDSQGYIAEKNRWQPWSGGPMEGTLELERDGRVILIRRGPKGSTPFGFFEAVDAASGAPIPGLTGENCGELLLGVPREVFERSAFVGQGGGGLDGSPVLEARIAALASSGEEEVSRTQVERRLRDWLNRRKHNKTGLIPRLEEELAQTEDLLDRQTGAHRRAGEARLAIDGLEQERDNLRRTLDAHRRAEDLAALEKYQAAQEALRRAGEEESALRREIASFPSVQRLREAQGDLRYLNTLDANLKLAARQSEEAEAQLEEARANAVDPLFTDMTAADAVRRAQLDAEAAERQFRFLPWGIGMLVLSVAALLLLAVLPKLSGGLEFLQWIGAVVAAADLGVLIRGLRSIRALGRARTALLGRYHTDSPDGIRARAAAYQAQCAAAGEAEHRAAALQEALRQLTLQREELISGLLELVRPFAPQVSDVFGISAAISRALSLEEKHSAALIRLEGARSLAENLAVPTEPIPAEPGAVPAGNPAELAARLGAVEGELNRLRSELSRAEGERDTLGDPDLLRQRAGELRESLTLRTEEHAALSLALEGLEEAHRQLQERFSPALNRRAGAFLSALTGGKYSSVELDRTFRAQAGEAGAVRPRRDLTLSQGTAEQLYLAVRLAVCELVLPAEDPVPLVLDDVLDTFDDARMALALELLAGLGRERQILLFTCHRREGAWAAGQSGAAVLPLVKW